MSTSSAVTSVNNALNSALNGTSSSSGAGAATSLSMSDFLTLMTTQLKNQDPTQPMDSTQFVGQLAQFAQVSGIQSMQSSLATLTSSMLSSQALSGASLVGTSILTSSSTGNLTTAGGTLSGAVTVPAGASNVAVQVVDASGATVDTINVSTQEGQQGFAWNGQTSSGASAPVGTYTFQAIANVGGKSQAPAVSMIGTVASVSINSSTSSLTLNTPQLGAVPFSSVQAIN